MLLSSGVIWRHREWEEFRRECPAGDERLQRSSGSASTRRSSGSSSKGAPVVWEETGNPRTVGKRFEPRGVVEALAGELELGGDGCDGEAAILAPAASPPRPSS